MTFSDTKRKKLKIFFSLSDKRIRKLFAALCADICDVADADADVIVTDDSDGFDDDRASALRGDHGSEAWIILIDDSVASDFADGRSRVARLARPVSVAAAENLLHGIREYTADGNLVPYIELSSGDDGFELDTAEQSVIYAGKHLKLTEREFALFSVLWESAQKPVSRAELNKTIWSDSEDNSRESNVCDVYVSYLRKKIRRVFDFEAIVTIRGKGYMLVHK